MSAHCCPPPVTTDHAAAPAADPAYKRVLVIALLANLTLFVIEIGAGVSSNSVSLLADAIDFAGDAANYGLSIWALGAAAIWGSRFAFVKGAVMIAFGLGIAAKSAWNLTVGGVPEAATMGVIGFLALLTNLGVALLLIRFRQGNANMRAVWLCTRNDAIGNVGVMLAAVGVFGAGAAWPDLAVAALMGTLAIHSGVTVLRQSRAELTAHSQRRLQGIHR
jgi:cation diffusion facilitator family transporter